MTTLKNWENNGTEEIGLVTPTLRSNVYIHRELSYHWLHKDIIWDQAFLLTHWPLGDLDLILGR